MNGDNVNRKTYFDKAAETWDQKYNTPQLTAFLTNLVPQFGLKSGDRILDVGSGTGLLIPFLLQVIGPSGSITGIDYSEKMIQICKSKYSYLQNVTLELQDIEELNFPSNSFDAVTCFGLFSHIENKMKALFQIYRVLKHGGKLIIAHALSSSELKTHHISISSTIAHDIIPEEPEMRRLLEQAGFIVVDLKDKRGCYFCLSIKP